MNSNQHRAVLLGAFGAALSFGAAIAQDQASTPPFAPFSDFVAELHATTATKMTTQPFAAVKTPVAAEAMRQHLLGLYEGVSVKHSYALNRQTFDCVPIDQQPSVRQLGIKTIAAPPPKAPALSTPATGGRVGAVEASQRSQTAVDAFGNTQRCEAGSFPMRRITVQEISRFKTLQEFFQKGPAGAGQAPQKRGDAPPSEDGHSYAHESQSVNNYGGYSVLSLFRPYVYTGLNEVFSLSQQWYVGFSGGANGRQTAEIGLQNYPAKYGSENSALFIYYTANNYKGKNCYNHECAAFVQVNSNWHLGAGFNNYSTVGGAQYELALGFFLYNGNWWMAAGNDWVGYYPGSIYEGGQLSRYAQVFDLGGETDSNSTIWPPMGSGQYASAGWTRAAYHRSILYRDASNRGFNPSLTVDARWPSCQTATPATWGGATWGTYFFFGGPGGYNC